MSYDSFNDFNNAPEQSFTGEPIPHGSLARVILRIRPGGRGPGGWVTENPSTGAAYLDCEFTVAEGPYARRKVWTLIGLKGTKVDEQGRDKWADMGRSLIRAVLESARGIHPKDESPQAVAARRINSLGDLDGIEFVARIGVEKDRDGQYPDKNKILAAIGPDHRDYAALMGRPPVSQPPGHAPAQAPWSAQPAPQAAPQPYAAPQAAPQPHTAPQPQGGPQQPAASGPVPAWANR